MDRTEIERLASLGLKPCISCGQMLQPLISPPGRLAGWKVPPGVDDKVPGCVHEPDLASGNGKAHD